MLFCDLQAKNLVFFPPFFSPDNILKGQRNGKVMVKQVHTAVPTLRVEQGEKFQIIFLNSFHVYKN